MGKSVIYETKGRAREFNELAINLFTGCGHKCIYCYGATITHQNKDTFENMPRRRVSLDDIEQSAIAWRNNKRRVLLCFVTDPYQPVEEETKLTRRTIEILHQNGLKVVILTKGGKRSMRDFDLLTPQDAYATTLTLTNDSDSLIWEPKAAFPSERIEALRRAYELGIETWVSFEPVIHPAQTYELFQMTRGFVGHYKVGTMNYHPQGKNTNWRNFGWQIKRMMDNCKAHYYFKMDLLREMGINPSEFEQTWICK